MPVSLPARPAATPADVLFPQKHQPGPPCRRRLALRVPAHGFRLDWRSERLPESAAPSYDELDVRLAWNAAPGSEPSVTGRNLLHCEHPGSGPAATWQLVGRSVLINLSWHY